MACGGRPGSRSEPAGSGFESLAAHAEHWPRGAGLHTSRIQAFRRHAHVTTTMTYDTVITSADAATDLLPDLH